MFRQHRFSCHHQQREQGTAESILSKRSVLKKSLWLYFSPGDIFIPWTYLLYSKALSSSWYYTETSGGIHLRSLAPGQHSFEGTSQRGQHCVRFLRPGNRTQAPQSRHRCFQPQRYRSVAIRNKTYKILRLGSKLTWVAALILAICARR